LILMELNDPMPDPSQQRITPMFTDRATGRQLTVDKFDLTIRKVLSASLQRKGKALTPAALKKELYSLHSFRVGGGESAHEAAGAPLTVRKALGHWSSRAIFAYSRGNVQRLLTCIKNQDQDCALLQTVSGDMPMYPEARGSSLPGPYDVAVGSAIQDTSLTDELSSYYQSERGKTATSSPGLRDCEEISRLERSAVARSLR